MPERIAGLIERVTYHNPDNGFAVLQVQLKGRRDLVAVVGTVLRTPAVLPSVTVVPRPTA